MSEEKDESQMAEEQAMVDAGHHDGGVEEIEGVPPQIIATPGMPERQAVARRQARVREIMHTLPPAAGSHPTTSTAPTSTRSTSSPPIRAFRGTTQMMRRPAQVRVQQEG